MPWNDPVPPYDTSKCAHPWEATFRGRLRQPPVDAFFAGIINFARPLEYGWTARRVTGTVLEVGGGTSPLARRLSDAHRVTVVDIADYAEFYGEIPFVQIDGQVLPFANDSFDTVLAVSVLEHVEKDQLLINEMMRVGKRIVLTMPYSHRIELLDYRTDPRPEPLQRYYTLQGILDRFSGWRLLDHNYCTAPEDGHPEFCHPEKADVLMAVLERPAPKSKKRK